MARFTTDSSVAGIDNTDERIRRLESKIDFLQSTLQRTFVLGRLRTDYSTPPANSAAVTVGVDQLYDRILLSDAEYICINDSGSLAWRKVTLSSF